jgi:hypothetical protein
MTAQQWPQVLSSAVVPVIVISACGLLSLAFYNRLAAVVARLRALHRERLHEQDYLDGPTARTETIRARHAQVLRMLEEQTTRVARRARLLRGTLLCLLCTITSLIACSLAAGLSVMLPAAIYAAVALFVMGMLTMLCAAIYALREMMSALDPVETESHFVAVVAGERRTNHDAAAALEGAER